MKLGEGWSNCLRAALDGPRKSLNQSSSRFRFHERNCAIRICLRFPSVFALALVPTAGIALVKLNFRIRGQLSFVSLARDLCLLSCLWAFATDAAGKRFIHEKTRSNQNVSNIAIDIQLEESG